MPNIVLNKNVDASSFVYPYQPAKAVDGVLTPLARWVGSSPVPPSPGTPAPNWLSVDLGAYCWINRWVVQQMGAVGWSSNYNMADYKLQGSLDNASWFDIDTVTDNSVSKTDRTTAPTKARWARIYVTNGLRCNTNFASIVELELYNADPTSAKLTGLTISVGTLAPSFASTTYTYTADVGYDVSSITVTPIVEDSRAAVKVNGIPATSGQPSAPVILNTGSNTVAVQVIPFIGDPQNYTVHVTRASSPYLTGLVIKSGRATLTLSPSFSRNTLTYTTTASATTSVLATATAEDTGATIKIKGNPAASGVALAVPVSSGSNLIDIVISSGTGTDQKTYQCTIAVGS